MSTSISFISFRKKQKREGDRCGRGGSGESFLHLPAWHCAPRISSCSNVPGCGRHWDKKEDNGVVGRRIGRDRVTCLASIQYVHVASTLSYSNTPGSSCRSPEGGRRRGVLGGVESLVSAEQVG